MEPAELCITASTRFGERDIEGAISMFTEDCLWVTTVDGTFHGHDGLRAWYEQWVAQCDDDWHAQVIGAEALPDGRVLLRQHFQMRMRGSGLDLEAERALIMTVEGDRIASCRFFPSEEEARACITSE